MLWIISFYLAHNGQQAVFFLPQGVYMALLILLPVRMWPAIILPTLFSITWLYMEGLIKNYEVIFSPLLGGISAWGIQQYWLRFRLYWQRLLILIAGVTENALLQALTMSQFIEDSTMQILLGSFTGGVLLTPFVYLVFEFLRLQHRYHLLGLDTCNPPLRTSLIIWFSLFFIIGIGMQMVLSPALDRLLLIVVFLPNVVMAWKFGWQGGVLSGLLGSIMITVTRQVGGIFSGLLELEIFLASQSLLGIGLGIAISRQQHLAMNLDRYRRRLETELQTRRELAKKLIHTEENTRKQLARELHDEIGQNITAIQIQSQLVKRAGNTQLAIEAAGQINDLARRIHHSTRQLLRQLRPPVLDELSLNEALHHLVNEFAFAERGMKCRFDYRLTAPPQSETLVFTLYRLLQELLNNVSKHANASEVSVLLCEHDNQLRLEVKDNGCGISPQQQPGFGIQGMRERVSALGGELTLESHVGTRVIVNLPTNLQ